MVRSPSRTDCQGRSDTTPRPRCPVDTKSRLLNGSPSPSKAVGVPLLPPSGHIRELDTATLIFGLVCFVFHNTQARSSLHEGAHVRKHPEAPPLHTIQHCVLIAQCVNCTFTFYCMCVRAHRGVADQPLSSSGTVGSQSANWRSQLNLLAKILSTSCPWSVNLNLKKATRRFYAGVLVPWSSFGSLAAPPACQSR